MTYRDDHDAAIARAEALEREAAELREKTVRLEAENERLARERAALIEQVEAPRRALVKRAGAEEAAIVERQPPGRLVSSALHAHTALAIAAASLPLALLTVFMMFAGPSFAAFLLVLIGGVGAGLLTLGRFIEADERRERKLLAELPLPLDVAGYLEMLDQAHRSPATITVQVEMISMPDERTASVIERAVLAAAPDCAVTIDGRIVTIHSPAIDTRSAGKPDNVAIHRWFRRLLANGLLPIGAAHPIATISVRA